MTPTSLWRHQDFMKLWAGQTVSELGSVVTRTAVPLVALLVLGAGPFEMALLVVAASLAVLLVGFFAGAWVDRVRRRPVLIWADVLRAVLLFSIPVAFFAGVLRLEQLYVVVFLAGCLGSLFDAGYPAYVPSLIGVERVVEGNSKLATSSSLAEIGGPGLAGGLVQLIGAPFAILVDAISFVVSAISLGMIRTPEPVRPPRTSATGIRHEILEGLVLIRRHSVLVPLTVRSVIAHVAGSFYGVLYTIYLIDELHLSPFLLGVVVSAGGVGSLIGSFFASRVIGRYGFGPALIWTATGRLADRGADAARRRAAAARDADGLSAAADRRWAADDRERRRAVADPEPGAGSDPRPRQRRAGGLLARHRLPAGRAAGRRPRGSVRGPGGDRHRMGGDGGIDPVPGAVTAARRSTARGRRRARGAARLTRSCPQLDGRSGT